MLLGRLHECEVLDRLLEAVRGGESGALVVRGEPGVGNDSKRIGRPGLVQASFTHGI